MRKILLIFIVFFVIFQFVNIISHYLIFDRTSYQLQEGLQLPFKAFFVPWINFDGLNYLNIATKGYSVNRALAAFYPLYPLIIKIFSFNSVLNPIIIGLLVSYSSSIAGILLLFKLVQKEFNKKIAFRTFLLFILFPASFYLFAYYSEGLFFLFSVVSFWYLRKTNFLAATVFIILSSLTRLFGLSLIIVLFYSAFGYYKEKRRFPFIVLLSPIGFIFYSCYLWINFGNPLLMFFAQTDLKFGRTLTFLNPLQIFPDTFLKIIAGPLPSYDSVFVYPVIIIEAITLIYIILILIFSFGKIARDYWLYMFSSFLLIMLGGSLSSILRYVLLLFPAYIFLANKLERKYFMMLSSVFLVILIFACSLFLRNYWIA